MMDSSESVYCKSNMVTWGGGGVVDPDFDAKSESKHQKFS